MHRRGKRNLSAGMSEDRSSIRRRSRELTTMVRVSQGQCQIGVLLRTRFTFLLPKGRRGRENGRKDTKQRVDGQTFPLPLSRTFFRRAREDTHHHCKIVLLFLFARIQLLGKMAGFWPLRLSHQRPQALQPRPMVNAKTLAALLVAYTHVSFRVC